MAIECEFSGLKIESEKEIEISYRQKIIGSFLIDMVINDSVIVKVMRDENINEHHSIDAKNQLHLSEYEVCLILNFALDGQHKRLVFTNDIKNKN